MPQKRNPYALNVLRGGAGTLLGRLAGLLTTGLTPSARTDNWLYAYGEAAGALEGAAALVRLGSAVMTGLVVHADVLAEQAASHFTVAADVAEELSRRLRLDYRTAYRVVGRAVAVTMESGGRELTVAAVRAASAAVTGAEIPVTGEMLRGVTDPASVVPDRDAPGGCSPRRVQEHARRLSHRAETAQRWNSARRASNDQAEAGLIAGAQALLA